MLNYEDEFVQAIRVNLTKVIEQLDARDIGLLKKIGTFISRFGFVMEGEDGQESLATDREFVVRR